VASGPTLAFAASKRILFGADGYEETLAQEAEAQGDVFTTQDAVEGLAAFHQMRKACFSGR
jgi:enoyl-CoA hydratase/carnithine racemase